MFAGKLPEPFGAAEFRGSVLLTRTDDDGNPADFSLEEYEAFAAKAPEAWQASRRRRAAGGALAPSVASTPRGGRVDDADAAG